MKLWIVIHTHRHGEDVYPCFQDAEPTHEQAVAIINRYSEWEGPGTEADREDEFIEVRGPWELPKRS